MVPNKCSENTSYYCLVDFWTIALTFDSILLRLLYCSRFEMPSILLSYCLSLIFLYLKRYDFFLKKWHHYYQKIIYIKKKNNLSKLIYLDTNASVCKGFT